ncbi:MAG: hypothetical protein A2Y76_09955 [Planctomycetes bacterium RBG_13_60_9]|nr:MAG: hypothetical protein A2Y76_09955 [Planctomycetes bacterium RBG_13_60_9]
MWNSRFWKGTLLVAFVFDLLLVAPAFAEGSSSDIDEDLVGWLIAIGISVLIAGAGGAAKASSRSCSRPPEHPAIGHSMEIGPFFDADGQQVALANFGGRILVLQGWREIGDLTAAELEWQKHAALLNNPRVALCWVYTGPDADAAVEEFKRHDTPLPTSMLFDRQAWWIGQFGKKNLTGALTIDENGLVRGVPQGQCGCTDVQKLLSPRCPKCGFTYRYDGRSCSHCGYRADGSG